MATPEANAGWQASRPCLLSRSTGHARADPLQEQAQESPSVPASKERGRGRPRLAPGSVPEARAGVEAGGLGDTSPGRNTSNGDLDAEGTSARTCKTRGPTPDSYMMSELYPD